MYWFHQQQQSCYSVHLSFPQFSWYGEEKGKKKLQRRSTSIPKKLVIHNKQNRCLHPSQTYSQIWGQCDYDVLWTTTITLDQWLIGGTMPYCKHSQYVAYLQQCLKVLLIKIWSQPCFGFTMLTSSGEKFYARLDFWDSFWKKKSNNFPNRN